MTDFLYMISQAKLAEYYDTRIDLPIRKYVLIANTLRQSTTLKEDKAEEQWLDTCLDALDKQEEKAEDQWLDTFLDALGGQEDGLHDDAKKQAITLRHYSFTPSAYDQQQKLIEPSSPPLLSTSSSHQQKDVNIYQIVLS